MRRIHAGPHLTDGAGLLASIYTRVKIPAATRAQKEAPMLPPFMIEQIRRREEQQRKTHDRPQLELPLPERPPSRGDEAEEVRRGVIVIQL